MKKWNPGPLGRALTACLMTAALALPAMAADSDWSANVAAPTSTGTDIAISSGAELSWVAQQVNAGNSFAGQTITLAEDIDLSGLEWVAIGTSASNSFNGTFDGDGYAITGLTMDTSESHVGLFGYVGTEGSVEDLTVEGTVSGDSHVAGLAGTNAGTLTGCTSNVAVSGNDNVGGLAGYSTGTVTECTNLGTISGSGSLGAVVGYNNGGTVSDCSWLADTASRGVGDGGGDTVSFTTEAVAVDETDVLTDAVTEPVEDATSFEEELADMDEADGNEIIVNEDGSVTTKTVDTQVDATTGETVTTTTYAIQSQGEGGTTTNQIMSLAVNEDTGATTEVVTVEVIVSDGSFAKQTITTTTAADGTVVVEQIMEIDNKATGTSVTATIAAEDGAVTVAQLLAAATQGGEAVTIPAEMLSQVAAQECGTILIQVQGLEFYLDEQITNVLIASADENGDVVIAAQILDGENFFEDTDEALTNVLVVALTATVDGLQVIDFQGGTVTMVLPYVQEDEDAPILVYYVGEEGTAIPVEEFEYDAEQGLVTFTAEYASYYVVAEEIVIEAEEEEAILPEEEVVEEDVVLEEVISFAFADVLQSDWFSDAVQFVAEQGLMTGLDETTFEPDEALSRGMAAAILYRMEGEPDVEGDYSFEDVDPDAYYAKAIAWAQSVGIVTGYSETEFGPDDIITREQMTTILYRYAQYKDMDVSVGENTNILSYTDVSEVEEYAIPAFQWACGAGVIQGTSASTLSPQNDASRAEMATVLMRFATL